MDTASVNKVSTLYMHGTLFKFLVWGEGLVYTICFIAAAIILLFNGLNEKKEIRFIWIIALFPFILFSFSYRGNRPATFTSSIPLIPVIIVFGICALERLLKIKWRILTILVIICITISAAPKIITEMKVTSGYKEMCDFLVQRNAARHFTTNNSHCKFYINRESGDFIPLTLAQYNKKEYFDDIEYFTTDIFYYARDLSQRNVFDYLINNGELVKTIDNNWIRKAAISHEHIMLFFTKMNVYFEEPELDKIKIYKIPKGILRQYYK